MKRSFIAMRVLTSLCACVTIQALPAIVFDSNGAIIPPDEYQEIACESGYYEEVPVTDSGTYKYTEEYPDNGDTIVYEVIPADTTSTSDDQTTDDYSEQSSTQGEYETTESCYETEIQTEQNNVDGAGNQDEGTTSGCEDTTTGQCQGQNQGCVQCQGQNQGCVQCQGVYPGQFQGQNVNVGANQNAGQNQGPYME